MPLGEITEIVWFAGPAHGSLDVLYGGGKALPMALRGSNAALPAALAEAANLPVPSLIGPARMAVASLIMNFGYLAGLLLPIAAAVAWLPRAETKPIVQEMGRFEIYLTTLLLTIPAAAALVLGVVLGAALSLILLRLVLNAEAFRLWLESNPHPGWSRPLPAFALPTAFRLAGLPYSRRRRPDARKLKDSGVKLTDTLEPDERVLWRDPSQLRSGLPYILWFWLILVVILVPRDLTDEPWTWTLRLALLTMVLVAIFLARQWLTASARERANRALVTGKRVLYQVEVGQSPPVALPLSEVAGVALGAGGSVDISQRDGGTTRLLGLRRPERFALAAAKAARAPIPPVAGRLDGFSIYCWGHGALLFVIAALLLKHALLPGGPHLDFTDLAVRTLAGLATIVAAYWIGAHLNCLLGLIVARTWVSAGEVRAWLNAQPRAGSGMTLYRWSLWKSRLYFLLAEWLWGEPMNGPNGEAAGHG